MRRRVFRAVAFCLLAVSPSYGRPPALSEVEGPDEPISERCDAALRFPDQVHFARFPKSQQRVRGVPLGGHS